LKLNEKKLIDYNCHCSIENTEVDTATTAVAGVASGRCIAAEYTAAVVG